MPSESCATLSHTYALHEITRTHGTPLLVFDNFPDAKTFVKEGKNRCKVGKEKEQIFLCTYEPAKAFIYGGWTSGTDFAQSVCLLKKVKR
jgi:hypothetical protein